MVAKTLEVTDTGISGLCTEAQQLRLDDTHTASRITTESNVQYACVYSQTISFLELPRELRDKIYLEVVTSTGGATLGTSSNKIISGSKLCLVSRQLRDEFYKVLHVHAPLSLTVYDFDFSTATAFLANLTTSELHAMRARLPRPFTITLDATQPFSVANTITGLRPWLKQLTEVLEDKHAPIEFSYVAVDAASRSVILEQPARLMWHCLNEAIEIDSARHGFWERDKIANAVKTITWDPRYNPWWPVEESEALGEWAHHGRRQNRGDDVGRVFLRVCTILA